MTNIIIRLGILAIYIIGVTITALIWGYFCHENIDNCREGTNAESDSILQAGAVCIFWPICLPVLIVYQTAKKMYYVGKQQHIEAQESKKKKITNKDKKFDEIITKQKEDINRLNQLIEEISKTKPIESISLIVSTQETTSYRETPLSVIIKFNKILQVEGSLSLFTVNDSSQITIEPNNSDVETINTTNLLTRLVK